MTAFTKKKKSAPKPWVYTHCTTRYVEQLETLKSQEKSIVRNAQVVEQMYALLAQYDVKAPSEDMVQVDDLRTMQVRGMPLRGHENGRSCFRVEAHRNEKRSSG